MERRFIFLAISFLLNIYIICALNHTLPLCRQCQCLGGSGRDPFSVDCDNMHFEKFPEIWKDLRTPWRLRIDGNSLTEVPAFKKLDNLTSLSFKYNMISKIAEGAFQNLTNLESLILSHNNVSENTLGPDTFRGPYQDKLPDPLPLKTLVLSYNKIKQLPKGVFRHLVNLTTLDLSHNPFVDFSLKTAETFSELPSLQTLDLSYTKLQRLPNHFFAELTSLAYLDLSGNDFTVVPSEVNYARSLRSLSLNDNVFGVIYEDSFWDTLKSLETLHLSKSKTLFKVDNGAFGNLSSLSTLWLNDNVQLSMIMPGAFTNKLNHTVHLQELHLENNHLKSISETALPWKDIPYINLQGNPWNCDCKFETLAKGVLPTLQNRELTQNVMCVEPPELMGRRVTDPEVQTHKFVCKKVSQQVSGFGFLVVATIVVGTLLLVTGTIIFSYVLFRRTKVTDWIGNNVKYRRTLNEDEEVIASNLQY